jgi:hypothetical protein
MIKTWLLLNLYISLIKKLQSNVNSNYTYIIILSHANIHVYPNPRIYYFKLFNILSTDNVLSISDCFAQPLLAWPMPNNKNAKCIE